MPTPTCQPLTGIHAHSMTMGTLRPSAAQPCNCCPKLLATTWVNVAATDAVWHNTVRRVQAHAAPHDVPDIQDNFTSIERTMPDPPSTTLSSTVHTLMPTPTPTPLATTLAGGHTWLWAVAILAAVRVSRKDLNADSYFERRRKVCGVCLCAHIPFSACLVCICGPACHDNM